MPRAAHRDVLIERGVTWRVAFQLWAPTTTTQAASALVPGDHIMSKGRVETVYSVTPLNGSVEIRLGQGLWSDPVLTMKATALVQMAAQQTPTTVLAAYEFDYPITYDADGNETGGGPMVVEIPHTIGADGTVLLTLDVAATLALPGDVGQWDATIQQSNGDYLRVLEGQFAAIATVSGAPIPVSRGGAR